jgi:hypothetical protein
MAVFNYIDWVARKPITAADLSQMSENDQYLYDQALAMPQGILGWAQKTTDRNMGSATVGDWYTMADFDVTVTVGENRMVKATYVCKSVNGGASAGIKGLAARIRHTSPDTTYGRIDVTVESGYRRACPPVIHVGTLTAGSHTFTVQHVIYSAVNTGGVLFEATAAGPHQLIIEDLGAYMDAS